MMAIYDPLPPHSYAPDCGCERCDPPCRGCADPYCRDCVPDQGQRILDLEGAVDDLRAECRRLRAELAAAAPTTGAPKVSIFADDAPPF